MSLWITMKRALKACRRQPSAFDYPRDLDRRLAEYAARHKIYPKDWDYIHTAGVDAFLRSRAREEGA